MKMILRRKSGFRLRSFHYLLGNFNGSISTECLHGIRNRGCAKNFQVGWNFLPDTALSLNSGAALCKVSIFAGYFADSTSWDAA